MKNSETTTIWMELLNIITTIYIFLVMCIYPLVNGGGYSDILQAKSGFLWNISIGYAVLLAVFLIVGLPQLVQSKKNQLYLGITDIGVISFGICAAISWSVNANKAETWSGQYGRNMGLLSILICVLMYFATSRLFRFQQAILLGTLAAGGLVFLLAVVNHIGVDPLHMYSNYTPETAFISTLGNINCLAAYVGIMLPFGMVLFTICENRLSQIIYGGFCLLGFAGMIASVCDSPYLTVAAAFVFLFFAGRNCVEYQRIAILVIEYAAAGLGMELLRGIRGDEICILLSGLPKLLLDVRINGVCLAAGVIFYLWMRRLASDSKNQEKLLRRIKKWTAILLLAVVVVLVILVVWVNLTMGIRQAKRDLGSWYRYLYINDKWGTGRLLIWQGAVTTYERMPLLQRLIGYGPAGFYYAIHQFLTDKELSVYTWGNLLDAHCEYLQYLVSIGLFGLLSYLTVFFSAVISFARKMKENKYLMAFAVMTGAFLIQGCINNTHIYIEPLAFLLLGMGENLQQESTEQI